MHLNLLLTSLPLSTKLDAKRGNFSSYCIYCILRYFFYDSDHLGKTIYPLLFTFERTPNKNTCTHIPRQTHLDWALVEYIMSKSERTKKKKSPSGPSWFFGYSLLYIGLGQYQDLKSKRQKHKNLPPKFPQIKVFDQRFCSL